MHDVSGNSLLYCFTLAILVIPCSAHSAFAWCLCLVHSILLWRLAVWCLVLAGVVASGGRDTLIQRSSLQSRWTSMTKAGVPAAWASVLARGVSTKQPELLVEQHRCSPWSKRRLLRCTCWLSSGPTLQTSQPPEMLRYTSALHCQPPCLARIQSWCSKSRHVQ